MSTLLSGTNAADRLVEALAGSTALATADPSGPADMPMSPMSGSTADDTGDASGTAAPSASAAPDSLPLGNLLEPVTSLLDSTTGDPTGGSLPVLGSLPNVGGLADGPLLTLAGADGTAQPVLDATNVLVKDVHNVLENLSHETGTSDLIHNVTSTGETIGLGTIGVPTPSSTGGSTNLVTDLLNAPATLLDGGGLGTVVSQIGTDLTNDVHALDGIVNSLLNIPDGANVVPTLIFDLGHDLQSLPLLSVNGNSADGGGGLLDGLLGNLHGSDTGHLVDVNVGPEQTNGQSIDLLAAPTGGDHHTVDVSAVDVGQNGPHLLDLNALTGSDGLNLPGLSGAGTDGLTGNLLGNLNLGGLLGGGVASGNSTSAPVVSAPVDVSAMLHDLISSPLVTDHGILDTHGAHIL